MHATSTDTVLRKRFRIIGTVLTIGCVGLTTTFALSVTSKWYILPLLIATLAAADLGNAYIWPFVLRKIRECRWDEAGFAAPFGVISTIVCLVTAFGSLSHVFGESVAAAKHQNVKLDDVGAIIAKEEDNERIYSNRIAELSKANGGWVTTATADGLRAKIPGLELAIQQESARGGCKTKCLERTKERDDVMERIGTLETLSKTEAMLKATREALAKYRDKRGVTDRGESGVLDQNASLAGLLTLSLDPSDTAQRWTGKGVAWLIVLFMVAGALGFNSLGHLSDEIQEVPGSKPTAGAPVFQVAPQLPAPKAEPTSSSTYLINSTDPSVAAKLAALRDAFAKVGKPA